MEQGLPRGRSPCILPLEMGNALRLVSLALAFLGTAIWLFGGPHLGWSRTTERRMLVDDLTGLEYPVIEPKVTLGIDFLGVALVGAVVIFSLSFCFRAKTTETPAGTR